MKITPYYESGGITIYNGNVMDILPQLAHVRMGCIIADPPYGVGVIGKSGKLQIGGVSKFRGMANDGSGAVIGCVEYAPVVGDNSTRTASEAFRLTARLWPKARQVWWGANYYCNVTGPSPCWISWDKERSGTSFSQCELAWTNLERPSMVITHRWNGLLRKTERGERYHPTQKPVALYSWIIQSIAHKTDRIMDPFAGSGPCLVAAKRLGRRAVGIEISEAYCRTIVERLEKEEILPDMVVDTSYSTTLELPLEREIDHE